MEDWITRIVEKTKKDRAKARREKARTTRSIGRVLNPLVQKSYIKDGEADFFASRRCINQLPRWFYVLKVMPEGRWASSRVINARLPWLTRKQFSPLLVRLENRGHIRKQLNPKFNLWVSGWRQTECQFVYQTTLVGRNAVAWAVKAELERNGSE